MLELVRRQAVGKAAPRVRVDRRWPPFGAVMLLGKVIKLAMTAQSDFPMEVTVREPELAALLESEAERTGLDVPSFVADTISHFMVHEDGESWTTIVGNIQRTDDPGYTFISTIGSSRP